MSSVPWSTLAREFNLKPTSGAAREMAKRLWHTLDVTRQLPDYDIWWLQQVAELIDEGTKPLIDALEELLPEVGWRSGPNVRKDYYCEFCGDEAIKRGKSLIHTEDCLVTKAHDALAQFKREEQTDGEQPSTRSD